MVLTMTKTFAILSDEFERVNKYEIIKENLVQQGILRCFIHIQVGLSK